MTKQEEDRIRIAEAEGKLDRPNGHVVEFRRWDTQTDGVFERVAFPDGSVRPCYTKLPKYDTIDAIQRAVLAQDEEFQQMFGIRLATAFREKSRRHWHELTAADWCDCFIAVLDERSGK